MIPYPPNFLSLSLTHAHTSLLICNSYLHSHALSPSAFVASTLPKLHKECAHTLTSLASPASAIIFVKCPTLPECVYLDSWWFELLTLTRSLSLSLSYRSFSLPLALALSLSLQSLRSLPRIHLSKCIYLIY